MTAKLRSKPRQKSVAALKKQAMRKDYTDYLKSPRWKAIRAKVIFRDNGQCQRDAGKGKCLSRNDIEVHHLTYVRFGNEQLGDLITLCHDCHKKLHKHHRKNHG